jgi:hypothetical protein
MKLGLDQKSLASQVGVSRQWIVDGRNGCPQKNCGFPATECGCQLLPKMHKCAQKSINRPETEALSSRSGQGIDEQQVCTRQGIGVLAWPTE